MSFRPRHLVLPVAAVVIAGLCAWKTMRPHDGTTAAAIQRAPAPLFVERNHELWPIKLSAYVGRHRILVAFFDGEAGADRSELLLRLKRDHARLEREGYVVVAIGDADPIANRRAVERADGFPFEVLGDVGDAHAVDHDTLLAWGRLAGDPPRVVPGLVVVDRTGYVRWRDGAPAAEVDADATLDAIVR